MVEPQNRSRLADSRNLLSFYGFFVVLLANFAASSLEFSVEEYSSNTSRHYHRTRHVREKHGSPYKSAASTTTNTLSDQYESFSLNCPHVADASNDNVRIEVTWTLNDTIWLKIDEGEKKIFNRLTTFNKRVVAGKTVLRVLLNNGRYFFDYDELTGDFAMEIRPVYVDEDAGVWQCHVTVYQKGNTHTLTSRSRVKVPHGQRPHNSRQSTFTSRFIYDYLPIFQQKHKYEQRDSKESHKVSSFTRNEHEVIQISRDELKRPKTVVFDRQPPTMPQARQVYASVDYEMSINQADEEPYYTPRSRVRSAYFSSSSSHKFISLIIASLLYYMH
ncbi:hypothetical protein GCK32_005635 [Trichostrongylus colubriformis]|uniref:Uncharacterized protein n=1 Tax=Trichostrongylus colubriformis TaxID=6319 RepID=A0AAN8EW39_TRICO